MVVVENWQLLKATGAAVLLRHAMESMPSANTLNGNGSYVEERGDGCFALGGMYLKAYSMYMFGLFVEPGPPPLPMNADGSPLSLAFTSFLYTDKDDPVTCAQVRARVSLAMIRCDCIFACLR
jgi:hypothetical protein